MSWKVKLVLLYANLFKPIDNDGIAIGNLRKKSESSARLGTLLFDRKVPVSSVINIKAGDIPVRIYDNDTSTINKRVVIYYHGGGFVLYGLDSHDNVCRRLCATNNCLVVSVDYRLAPEHTFPAAHDDAFAALQWVRKNIEQYGGNPADLVVAGDSAGANLSTCMAHRCRKENINLTAQVLVYPWVDGKLNNPSISRNGKGYMLTEETMFWFQRQYTPRVEDQCVPHVSPYYESSFEDLAPAFILTAEFDPLIDDGVKYYEQLKAAGNRVKYREYKGLFHGFFNIPKISSESMQAYEDIKEFLQSV